MDYWELSPRLGSTARESKERLALVNCCISKEKDTYQK